MWPSGCVCGLERIHTDNTAVTSGDEAALVTKETAVTDAQIAASDQEQTDQATLAAAMAGDQANDARVVKKPQRRPNRWRVSTWTSRSSCVFAARPVRCRRPSSWCRRSYRKSHGRGFSARLERSSAHHAICGFGSFSCCVAGKVTSNSKCQAFNTKLIVRGPWGIPVGCLVRQKFCGAFVARGLGKVRKRRNHPSLDELPKARNMQWFAANGPAPRDVRS
jgi:hypothetical protein